MRFIASILFAATAFAVVACGGGGADGGGNTDAGSSPRVSITPTTPVPAPPWATGTSTTMQQTTAPSPGSLETAVATAPSTSAATASATPSPTQPAAASTLTPEPTGTPTPEFPLAVTIGIQDDVRFAPNRVTIAAGGRVTFAWNGEVFHNAVSDKGGFITDLVKSGSFTFTMSAPGTYAYMCEVHSTTMKGLIEVK